VSRSGVVSPPGGQYWAGSMFSRNAVGSSVLSAFLLSACGGEPAAKAPGPPPAASPAPAVPTVVAAPPAAPATTVAAKPEPPAPSAPVHWGYTGEEGPAHWGDLSPDFALCKSGAAQTPVDLPAKVAPSAALPPLEFAFGKVPVRILNNGHTVQVNVDDGATTKVRGETWKVAQFHLHGPSEHTVAGKGTALELHLVHKNDKGELLVVGVFIVEGQPNAALAPYFDHAPSEVGKEPTTVPDAFIDLAAVLPKRRAYYHYTGSLTIPPCTEGVEWYVLAAPLEASRAQIEAFRAAVHGDTARPVQPLGDRKIVERL